MRIVYSPRHTRHRPRTELLYGKPVEHPERPERVEAVRAALEGTRWAGAVVPPREYPLSLAESVHQPAYVRHLRT
ncbi:MAG TPA: histone deacetylase family protein, partial [Chloroflexota bacterium]|nr:histone deacetylase family protein [Chloroflexota bacterium]